MMKFIYKDGHEVEVTIPDQGVSWDEALLIFQQFLMAAGYMFPCHGTFEFVPEDEDTSSKEAPLHEE